MKALILSIPFLCSAWMIAGGGESETTQPDAGLASASKSALTTAVDPKPLSEQVKKGLEWLLEHQLANGGFGQGEESRNMGNSMDGLKEKANVADTCIAMQALLRSGSSPAEGPYASQLQRALEYVLSEIEAADADSMSITSVNGTRVQGKLGPHIDTFLASAILAEIDNRVAGEKEQLRLDAALKKVLRKIELNQKEDGSWGGGGWAPALAQSVASKGLNRAVMNGQQVDSSVLQNISDQAGRNVQSGASGLAAEGSAGVALYAGSSNLGKLQDTVTNFKQREKDLRKAADSGETKEEREQARDELKKYEAAQDSLDKVQGAVVDRMDDAQFIAGFGSNGGEEFLSYMNIGESLVLKGDKTWQEWDVGMTDNLNRIQNADGSWSGHHCITGRTFCTSTALMVLMTDRVVVPVEAK